LAPPSSELARNSKRAIAKNSIYAWANAPLQSLLQKRNPMFSKYEDNFGFYCMDDDVEELKFFRYILAKSKPTKCVRCKQKVRLLKQIKLCAACSQALEFGEPSDPAWGVPTLRPVV
jgi:hypothetical protein